MGATGNIPRSESSKGLGVFGAGLSRYLNAISRYVPMYPKTRVWLQRRRNVTIGKNVFIGTEVLFDEVFPQNIILEDDVTIIARSTILAHAFYPTHLAKTLPNKESITRLKKGCYVGLGSLLLPGVTIGEYAIIGAGSVVTKNIPDRAIAMGNPAKITAYSCICGNRLPAQFTRTTCATCKRVYKKQGDAIEIVRLKKTAKK